MNPSLAALTCTLYLGISMALKSPHNFFKLKLKNPKSVTKIQISLIINVIYQSPVVFWFYCNFAAVSVMMPITMAATPNREKRSSFQEGGAVIVFFRSLTSTLVCSKEPELSITMSARARFTSSGSCEVMRLRACSLELLSRAIKRASWVRSSTHTTIMGRVSQSILASNNSGTSNTTTEVPSIQCFSIS